MRKFYSGVDYITTPAAAPHAKKKGSRRDPAAGTPKWHHCEGRRLRSAAQSVIRPPNAPECLLAQRVFRLRRELSERRHIVDRQLGKHLSIDDDSRLFQTVHEGAVGHSAGSGRSVDSGDPQAAEIPLLPFSIDIRP